MYFIYERPKEKPFYGSHVDEQIEKRNGCWYINGRQTKQTDDTIISHIVSSAIPYIVLITDPATRHLPKMYDAPDVTFIRPQQILKKRPIVYQTRPFQQTFVREDRIDRQTFEQAQKVSKQVVLSERATYAYEGSSYAIYEYLRTIEKQSTHFYIETGKQTILGASPETIIAQRGDQWITELLAGTAPKGQIEKLEEEKEIIEHEMLVKSVLQRLASTACRHERVIRTFHHVYHYSTTVQFPTLNQTQWDALFPADTLIGTPREKAIPFIRDVQKNNRQYFGGAVGLIGKDVVHLSLLIRMAVAEQSLIHYEAGAGITAQSTYESERAEIKQKRALFETFSIQREEKSEGEKRS